MAKIVRYFNHFGDIDAPMWAKLDQAVRDAAREIRATAAANAPIDTGALRNSMYVTDDQGTDYDRKAIMAAALRHSGNRPDSPAEIVPEVFPEAYHEAVIGSAVAHAILNELGTSQMPARPFLVPAVEAAAPKFFRDVEDALDG